MMKKDELTAEVKSLRKDKLIRVVLNSLRQMYQSEIVDTLEKDSEIGAGKTWKSKFEWMSDKLSELKER